MEAYPAPYVQHELPLVYLSGLGEQEDSLDAAPLPRQESGSKVTTSSETCTDERAQQLLEELMKHDGSSRAWNSEALPGPTASLKYRMKPISRTFNLPPRKAAPLPQAPSEEGNSTPPRHTELHSTLSPLSPGSPIYPEGIMTPLWFTKHQHSVPSLVIAFFKVHGNDNAARNEQVQTDINAIRATLGRSGYKTRLSVVLLSDRSILDASELEEHISAIRRATTMDPKTGLFFMPPMSSSAEIATFVRSLLSTLQPLMVEHYRDLTKHARRKKARGGSASLASSVERGGRSLSASGWNVRYEIKQGVFAEFRQEMDVAERHYSAAIEELCSSEGLLETKPSWSSVWNNARLLCDVVALRVVRCQLWVGQTTGAVISWVNYKARTKDLVDRRGMGCGTYGWFAWEARWAEIMGQLIRRASLPAFQPSDEAVPTSVDLNAICTHLPPEKALATERIAPFEQLHHPGYWFVLAFEATVARRVKALDISEEDRTSPDQTPASAVAQRSRNYDTYLAPFPHEEFPLPLEGGHDHHLSILDRLAGEASQEFDARGQHRSAKRITFELAQELIKATRYSKALDLLVPLWEHASSGDSLWSNLYYPLLQATHECASHASNSEVFLSTAWELLSFEGSQQSQSTESLTDYIRDQVPSQEKIATKTNASRHLSPVQISLAFAEKETHVGELVGCQLSLCSRSTLGAATLIVSQVDVAFTDGRTVSILHENDTSSASARPMISNLPSIPGSESFASMKADLSLLRSETRLFNFFLGFREANVVRIRDATIHVGNDAFYLQHTFDEDNLMRSRAIHVENQGQAEHYMLPWSDTFSVTVLPKPPKLQMTMHGLHKQYYVDERISLELELMNGEEESINATATVRQTGKSDSPLSIQWNEQDALSGEVAIGKVERDASHKVAINIDAMLEPAMQSFEIEVRYSLTSEPETPLMKVLVTELKISRPFEPKYNFGPLLHTAPWPSYFNLSAQGEEGKAEGLPHRWRLGADLKSNAEDELSIRSASVTVDQMSDSTVCDVAESDFAGIHALRRNETIPVESEFVTRKASLDDRRPMEVELSLVIKWTRKEGTAETTTRLPVPRLQLPSAEPRVLCTVEDDASEEGQVILHYHLENPSSHFLTFALTMEASDAFAFSGAKYRALSIAPLSRLRVDYRLVVHDRDEDRGHEDQDNGVWVWPVLQVVDSYYQKTLRVHSGGRRVRVDEKRGLAVQVKAYVAAAAEASSYVILERQIARARSVGPFEMDADAQKSKFAIHAAARDGQTRLIESLLNADKRLANRRDDDDRLPIHWATSSNQLPIVEILADQKDFDVDAQDGAGWTPLMIAASLKDAEPLVDFLLSKGADVNAKTNNGQVALHFTASKSNIDVARKLIEHKATSRVKDKRGQLPLHRAAAVGHVPLIKLMLENRSPVSATDMDGSTALHHAIAEGHGDAAVVLLKAGAETDKRDGSGMLAIDLAPDGKVRDYIERAAQEEGIELSPTS
ncbi:hypothetical protein KC318_g8805 [Hortaea werneckii]|nr:hypothetical protein KC318_g8805 [Hortaea werneckii]